ncbi:MAG: MmgE/PrpD family protein [Acetobacteraceae bacterium]|nr:MmgE/PrpD family protein [Acetobacteraceae bacterium]
MVRPHAQLLADYLAELRLENLPPQARPLLQACLLDYLGCLLGGLGTPVATVLHGFAAAFGPGICSVAGRVGRAPPEAAALVNGAIAHALVFDDLHRHAKLHPGVAVIPAALAAAEIAGADGASLLLAIAAGYEAAARVGVALGLASHRLKGWRAAGTAGSFGAAVAAARLWALDKAQMHHAIAAAAAQASANWAFRESGGMELYLAAGTAARNGLVAALLARSGFAGAAAPLEAADGGFLMLSSDAHDAAELSDQLGTRFRLLDTCIKMHPTCHSTQTALDAALILRERDAPRLADIDRIEVRAGEITRLQCGWPYAPGPAAKLIFHMGYAIAVALRNGRVMPGDFEGASPHDPELVRIAQSTEIIADPALTAIYAERKPSEVTLILRDGTRLSERVEFCRGEPENPADAATVAAKFRNLAGPRLAPSQLDRIAEIVLSIEAEKNVAELLGLLRMAATPGSASSPTVRAAGPRTYRHPPGHPVHTGAG